jgi:hypothetical protein
MKSILPFIFSLFLLSGACAEAFMTIAPNQAVVCPCERATFDVTIANDETASRAFNLEVFSDPSISPLLKPSTIVVDGNSFETLKMFVNIPCDAHGTYTISARASSSFQSGGSVITDVIASSSANILILESGCQIQEPETPEPETPETPEPEIPDFETPTGEAVSGGFLDNLLIYATLILTIASASLVVLIFKNRKKDE